MSKVWDNHNVISFRIDPALKHWIRERAEQKGLSMSEWMVRMIEDAKERIDGRPTPPRPRR